MPSIDYKLTEDLDLEIENGDFKRTIGEQCDQQASLLIINTGTGSWKNHPLCGMGIDKYKNSSGMSQTMKREMSVQHEADGFTVNSIIVREIDDFFIDAERRESV